MKTLSLPSQAAASEAAPSAAPALTANQRIVQQMQTHYPAAPAAQVWPMAAIRERSPFRRMQYTKDELRQTVLADLAHLRELCLSEQEHNDLMSVWHMIRRHKAAEDQRLRLLPSKAG